MADQQCENRVAEGIEHSTMQMSADGRPQLVKRERRVMLLGRTGSGKSSLANKLLGRPDKRFTKHQDAKKEAAARQSEDPFFVGSSVSVTNTCQFGTAVRNGIKLTVVDTPGLFDTDTDVNNKHVQFELTRGLLLAEGKPHAFIIVIELGRVTQEDHDAFHTCISLFGKSHVIVVFSHGENLEEEHISIEESADDPRNKHLKAILEVVRASGMYVVMTRIHDRRQAETDLLMEKVNEVSEEPMKPWSDSNLDKLAIVFQNKVKKIKQEKNCNDDDAAIEARNKIVKWDEDKKLLLQLTGCFAVFIASCAFGVVGITACAVVGGICVGSAVAISGGVGAYSGVVICAKKSMAKK